MGFLWNQVLPAAERSTSWGSSDELVASGWTSLAGMRMGRPQRGEAGAGDGEEGGRGEERQGAGMEPWTAAAWIGRRRAGGSQQANPRSPIPSGERARKKEKRERGATRVREREQLTVLVCFPAVAGIL